MLQDNYILGLLYGDGHFFNKEKYEQYMFATTHKELATKVASYLNNNNIKYLHYNRSFPKDHEKQNYEITEIIIITDKNFIEYLKLQGFNSNSPEERISWNKDFIRGYIETKGSFIVFSQRNSQFWRFMISGEEDNLKYIKRMMKNELGISTSKVVRRNERVHLGIISKSYRLGIQNRNGVRAIIEFIRKGDMSKRLEEMIINFEKFDASAPFNMKRKVFKHYKNAVGFMSRHLGIEIKGVAGGGRKKGFKPVYLWEDGVAVSCFAGWDMAYKWVSNEFKERLGYEPPEVHDE